MRTCQTIQLEYEYHHPGSEEEPLRGAITLPTGRLVIGRSASCFLVLNEPTVSRVHLRLRVSDDEVVAEDPGSSNGTLLNGAILRGSAQLMDGDELRIGKRVFRVKVVDRTNRSEPRTTPLEEALLSDEPQTLQLDHLCSHCGQAAPHMGRCPSCGLELETALPLTRTKQEYRTVGRRDRRSIVELQARYSGSKQIDGSVANLSRNGLFLACTSFDEIGTRCRIELASQDGEPAVFEGFVRHVIRKGRDRVSGMGIEFAGGIDEAGIRWLAKQLLRAIKNKKKT